LAALEAETRALEGAIATTAVATGEVLERLRRLRTAVDLEAFETLGPLARTARREVEARLQVLARRVAAASSPAAQAEVALSEARARAVARRAAGWLAADAAHPTARQAEALLTADDRAVQVRGAKRLEAWLMAAAPDAATALEMLTAPLALVSVGGGPRAARARMVAVQGVSPAELDAVLSVLAHEAPRLGAHYAKVKGAALGLMHLDGLDRLRAWPGVRRVRLPWPRAVRLALGALGALAPEVGRAGRDRFAARAVHARSEGRPETSFSHPGSGTYGPFVRVGFTPDLTGTLSLTHELGHAAHQQLARAAGPDAPDPGHALAEAVALSAERVLLNRLTGAHGAGRLTLLAHAVEQDFGLLVRHAGLAQFELALRGELLPCTSADAVEAISALWCDTMGAATSLDMAPLRAHWVRQGAVFADPYYAVAYPLGLAVADAVAGGAVVPARYVQMLRAGGRVSFGAALEALGLSPPAELLRQAYTHAHGRLERLAGALRHRRLPDLVQ
jgi:oligoendopeptidase F